jgi:hypothetical protein
MSDIEILLSLSSYSSSVVLGLIRRQEVKVQSVSKAQKSERREEMVAAQEKVLTLRHDSPVPLPEQRPNRATP